jgi:ribonuclease D
LAGLPYPLGHGPLVSQVLGIRLAKGETLTEWRTRPLTRAQIHYAFDDVRHLLPVWERLSERLQKLDRIAWAGEEFSRLRELATPDDEGLSVSTDKWRRLRGAGSLDRRRLAILRELFYWREKTAAESNRPARTIVRDDLLVEITRRNPRAVRDLQPVRGLAKRHLDGIFEAIERGRALPGEQCPVPSDREQDAPQVAWIVAIMNAVLADFAAKEHLAANLVATTTDMKLLVKAFMQNASPGPESQLTRGWRAQHVLPHLQAILEGKKTVRIRDVRAEAPFGYE